jgi:hypothetical protein
MSVVFFEPIQVGQRFRCWRSLDLLVGLVALADRSGCRPDVGIALSKSSGRCERWSSGTVRGRATDPPHIAVGSVRAPEGSSSLRRPSLGFFARR